MITEQEIKTALPANLQSHVSQDLVDALNTLVFEQDAVDAIQTNFLSYTHVLKEGRFRLPDYLNAVVYVSWKLMGFSSKEAYQKTFPHRYSGLVAKGLSEKDIAAYVGSYNGGKLVNKILEQAMIPTWILNQDMFQKAINAQAELMLTAKSEKVRSDAANSLLTHLKKPEKHQIEVDLGIKETSGMAELRNMLTNLAEKQKTLIGEGMPTRDIAHQKLIEGTMVDVTPEDGEG